MASFFSGPVTPLMAATTGWPGFSSPMHSKPLCKKTGLREMIVLAFCIPAVLARAAVF